jgi:predicted choloylglycine hydrolase
MSHNVTLLDRSGAYATVFLGPDRTPGVSRLLACTNHQETLASPPSPPMTASVERQEIILRALDDRATTLPTLIARFLEPPIHSRRAQSPTVYTAVYRPTEGRADYLWPGSSWCQRVEQFDSGEYTHDYGEPIS